MHNNLIIYLHHAHQIYIKSNHLLILIYIQLYDLQYRYWLHTGLFLFCFIVLSANFLVSSRFFMQFLSIITVNLGYVICLTSVCLMKLLFCRYANPQKIVSYGSPTYGSSNQRHFVAYALLVIKTQYKDWHFLKKNVALS